MDALEDGSETGGDSGGAHGSDGEATGGDESTGGRGSDGKATDGGGDGASDSGGTSEGSGITSDGTTGDGMTGGDTTGGDATDGESTSGSDSTGDESTSDGSTGDASTGTGDDPSCTDLCDALGARSCSDDGVRLRCEMSDDGCLAWTNDPCDPGLVCDGGFCALDCTDECDVIGARQCTSPAEFEACGDHDADGCLEWGTPQACGGTNVCDSGQCIADPAGEDEPPTAVLVATASGQTRALLDASSSRDDRTALEELEFRWDVDADGTWDTAYSNTPTHLHDYGAAGTFDARVEVRDDAGQTAIATRRVRTGSVTYVNGTIDTTTWSGTVVVLGDTYVPDGEVLTISPGTQVLFAYVPNSGGDLGTVGLDVRGDLRAVGTVDEPILFSVQGELHRNPGAYEGIRLRGPSARIEYARLEYAHLALDIGGGTRVDLYDSVVARNNRGVNNAGELIVERSAFRDNAGTAIDTGASNGGSPVRVTNSIIERNAGNGIQDWQRSEIAVAGTEIVSNGGAGIAMNRGELSVIASLIRGNETGVISGNGSFANIGISQSTIDENGVGVFARGRSSWSMELCNLERNDYEGAILLIDQGSFSLSHSNVRDNGRVIHGNVLDPDVSARATSGGSTTTDTWSTPDGETLLRIYVSYSGNAPGGASTGATITDPITGATLFGATGGTSTTRWVDVESVGATGMFLRPYGYSAGISVHAVHLRQASSDAEIVALRRTGVTLTDNHWGSSTIPVAALGTVDTSNTRPQPVAGAGY